MYACIYHINFFKIRVTVQTTNIFRGNKKSDPSREDCPATHPE